MDRETVDEIKRHFGMVAEDVRSDVRAVAEGVALLNDRVDRLEGRFEGRFDKLEGRFDRLEGRFDAFQGEVAREFAETRSMIKLSYTEVDRRLTGLEADLASLRARVDRLEAHAAS